MLPPHVPAVDCGGPCGLEPCSDTPDDPSLVTRTFVLVPLVLADFPEAKRALFLEAIIELMGAAYSHTDIGLVSATVGWGGGGVE